MLMTEKTIDGDYVCEQTAYYDIDAEKIVKLRVPCTGFLPSAGRR